MRYMIAIFILGVVSALFNVISPILTQSLIDNVFIAKKIQLLATLIALLALLFICSSIARYFLTYLSGKLAPIVKSSIQRGIFEDLQYKNLKAIYQIGSGDVLSRFMNDTTLCQQMFTTAIIQFFLNIIRMLLPLAIMILLKWDLTIICISPIFIYILLSLFLGKLLKSRNKRVLENTGKISSFLREALSTFPLTKTFMLEKYQGKRLDETLDEYSSSAMLASKTSAFYFSVAAFLVSFPLVLLFLIGGNMVIQNVLTIGTFVAFSSYLVQFYVPISALTEIWTDIKIGTAAFDRINELLEMEEENGGESELLVKGESIEFDHISFSYEQDKPVFKDLTLFFKKGINFLIGENGSGKTTILHLIMRLYLPDKGEIRIDGQDISKVTLESLRRNISFLSQNVQLLDTTAYENILIGKLEASEDEVIAAAKMAGAHDFILRLPQGYKTQVGEDGLTLSGGEKQKIALARAILKDAPIILLDELTSSVDEDSKKVIYKALRERSSQKIVIIVTHDCSGIIEGDNIADLSKI